MLNFKQIVMHLSNSIKDGQGIVPSYLLLGLVALIIFTIVFRFSRRPKANRKSGSKKQPTNDLHSMGSEVPELDPTISKVDDKEDEWLSREYYNSLATSAATNVQYLNTTISWAISLFTGAMVIILSRDSFPDVTALVSLSILMIMLGHFFVRAAKAYTNMLRFTSLEKLLVESKLRKGGRKLNIRNLVQMYHINWNCPVTVRTILKKVLFELGYFYFFSIVLATMVYALLLIGATPKNTTIVIGGAAITFFEIAWTMLRSPYFRNQSPLALSEEQA